MLVTRKNLAEVVSRLAKTSDYSIDTEATGLRAYHGDKLFSFIICDGDTSWYFNLQEYPGLSEDWVLPKVSTLSLLSPFFTNSENRLFLHNAKFDMTMLAKEGVSLAGQILDTEVMGRLLYNRHMKYSLGSLVKEIGLEKSKEVEEYIAKNKLFTWVKSPGKEKRAKWPHYDRVPFPIISRYGEQDGDITYKLAKHQLTELQELSDSLTSSKLSRTLMSLLDTESKLTKTCFAMEQAGIRIDRDYCQRAYAYESAKMQGAAAKFEALAGMPFMDSRITMAKAFTAAGEKYPTTEKGNPSFTDKVLESFSSPLAQILRDHRSAAKMANTYFANFLYFADENDRIHPNMRQAGTDTGRFSFSDPNLQNVPKEEDEGCEFPVRRAFIPTPGYFFAMLDYQAMEFRLLLEYAGEKEVIRKIREEGLDVHQATADQMGVTRNQAKTLNFGLLYGMGAEKLANSLGITIPEAKDLKHQYFSKLPGVQRFTQGVMQKANTRGHIFNWAGRVCHFPYFKNPRTGKMDRFAYKAPNHLIQGGCADVIKGALNVVFEYLQDKKSRMLLTIHDEILLEVDFSECYILSSIKKLMESAYPHKYLPMACDVDISFKSWADKRSVPSKFIGENLELALLKEL